MKPNFYIPFLLFLIISGFSSAQEKTTLRGKVFLDENANGIFDENEKGVISICISNGKDVVQTNEKGEWKMEAGLKKSVFIIKPAGFAVPVNQQQIPQHFSHEEGSTSSVINFPLLKQDENEKFSALFFGDTQARGEREMNFIFHDAVEELIGTDAVFGVSLGDIVADDPEMMDDVAAGIAQIGIPWHK